LGACKKEETPTKDRLEEMGFLGKWKLEYEELNGINGMVLPCCSYFTFSADSQPNDSIGVFLYEGLISAATTNGTFQVFESTNTLLFEYNGKQQSRTYTLTGNALQMEFTENNVSFLQGWRLQP
jgi:hypothetical protein